MNFIFMLTRDDQTVSDCLAVADAIAPLNLQHVGFKDVGASMGQLRDLHSRIKQGRATSYLEVVSTAREDALSSAQVAVELGVDCLLGGVWVAEVLQLIEGTSIKYFPFVGLPSGHPTRLGGMPDLIAQQCREVEQLGCAGVDLLAYRATEADPLELVRAARGALEGRLIIAGSIRALDQVAALRELGADAFTIGSAAFAGELDPRAGLLTSQLAHVQSEWLSST